MKIKSFLAKPFANFVYNGIKKGMATACQDQDSVFKSLVKLASDTEFGKEHHFKDIKNYEDFRQAIPMRDYEQLKPYIERIKEGKHNVLWKGLPIYCAHTSQT